MYETLNLEHPHEHPVLRKIAQKLSFPLSEDDLRDIQCVSQQFDQEGNMAGLAAPQIGIAKQIIVFWAPEDPLLKKWRSDFTQSMPKTIWINPSYEPIGTEKNEDYEGCFSVLEMAGAVKRFKKIRYRAYDGEGKLVEGEAEGYLARVIQHEIDHINGKLYIDYVEDGNLLPIAEYRERRRKAMQSDAGSYAQAFVERDRMGALVGAKFVSLSSDECIYEYEVSTEHFNPAGILHGGALYAAMDSSQGMLVHANLGETFKTAATGTATIKYFAPLRSGTIRIRTVIRERQNRKIFVDSTATDQSGKEVALLEEIWVGILK